MGTESLPIPYATKKLVAYMVIVALVYFFHHFATALWPNTLFNLVLATAVNRQICAFFAQN